MAREEANYEQVQAIWKEYIVDDLRLILRPHQLDENSDGPPRQCQITCIIGEDCQKNLCIIMFEYPIKIQRLHCDSSQRLFSCCKACLILSEQLQLVDLLLLQDYLRPLIHFFIELVIVAVLMLVCRKIHLNSIF